MYNLSRDMEAEDDSKPATTISRIDKTRFTDYGRAGLSYTYPDGRVIWLSKKGTTHIYHKNGSDQPCIVWIQH